jgi:hypothetical protein
MNANLNPTTVATSKLQPIQTSLPFEKAEVDQRIPAEKKPECVALIRELIEAVAQCPKPQAGGANE